jgi:hypothetical protein
MNAIRDNEKERKCGTSKLQLVAKKARYSQKLKEKARIYEGMQVN